LPEPVPLPPTRPDAIWDHAAGSLIAAEAGTIVTDLHGRALDFSLGSRLTANGAILCAHPALHGRLIEAIARTI
jgi:3'(2'), 5'-bisphosphate nucleotidase